MSCVCVCVCVCVELKMHLSRNAKIPVTIIHFVRFSNILIDKNCILTY